MIIHMKRYLTNSVDKATFCVEEERRKAMLGNRRFDQGEDKAPCDTLIQQFCAQLQKKYQKIYQPYQHDPIFLLFYSLVTPGPRTRTATQTCPSLEASCPTGGPLTSGSAS